MFVKEFSKIWPSDLVFDLTWPIFKLGLDIFKTNIQTKFYQNWVTNVAARVLTRISFDLTWWPRFWPDMTQIRTWPKYLNKFHQIGLEMLPQVCKPEFLNIWPSDLVFDPTWPTLELGLDIVKTNSLTMFHQKRVTNVASREVNKNFLRFDLVT